MEVNIYIETSIRGKKPSNGVVGFVMEAKGATLTQFGKVTNVNEDQSVIKALKYALKRIRQASEITIWTDNRYMTAAINADWLGTWVRNDFKTAKGKEVDSKEDWIEIAELLKYHTAEVNDKPHEYKGWLIVEVRRRNNNV